MKILGIETSCDETAAAVVCGGVEILSNVVVSQIDIFAEYGGVIPEVAARSHLEVILPVINKALKEASCTWEEIDAIAVTHAPGLLGSLLIGTLTARTLAILHAKPLYAVHHLKSHVYATWLNSEKIYPKSGLKNPIKQLTDEELKKKTPRDFSLEKSDQPSFPILALVVSGGHTQILRMQKHNQFKIVGTTRDDAVGECFDKVAKILGLPYPGGPSITKAAEGYPIIFDDSKESSAKTITFGEQKTHQTGDAKKYRFPHPKVEGLDFSFSGLKTAVLRAVQKEVGVPISYPSHKLKELLSEQQIRDFAASFQETAVEILHEKLKMALEKYPDTQSVVIAGGVSANKVLRETLPEAFFPALRLSGDNGAMVAAACYFEILSGVKPVDPYTLNIYPRISIEN